MKAGLLAIIILLASCGLDAKTDIMFACPSPSGSKIATLYRIAHGDSPINQEMHMNIRKVDSDFDDDMASFSFKHGYDAVVRWDSDHAMRIEFPQDSELTHQENVIFGTTRTFNPSDAITIIYQQNPSTHGYFVIEQRCFTASKVAE